MLQTRSGIGREDNVRSSSRFHRSHLGTVWCHHRSGTREYTPCLCYTRCVQDYNGYWLQNMKIKISHIWYHGNSILMVHRMCPGLQWVMVTKYEDHKNQISCSTEYTACYRKISEINAALGVSATIIYLQNNYWGISPIPDPSKDRFH